MLPPNNRKGSGFTNINRVVTANQGNKLGQTVTSGVQNQANQVKDQTQKATTSFNEDAQKNRLDTDEAKNQRDQTIGRFSNANETSVQKATDDEVNNFSRYRTGTYEGPNQLHDYQTLAGKAQNTEMLGDLSRSTGGRQELLKRFVGGSGYTQGQQGLDNLLLGQSGNALNQTRRATQGLQQDVAGANTQASNLAQEYANRAKIFGGETVNKLIDARNPISTKIDEQLNANQTLETTRKGNLQSLQNILNGSGDNYKNLDRIARLGLGLQSAKDAGYLTDVQAKQLLGDGGLIQRAETLGLDTNALINERIKDISAQNLNRGGAASAIQESQLNSLDRLLGKQGTDLEFNQDGADFQKGNVGFDTDTLNDYLNTTERAKYANDAKQLADQEAYNARYLNQAAAGASQSVQGAQDALGGALDLDPGAIFQGAGTTISGLGNLGTQGVASILEGVSKLNIGGKSLANSPAGSTLQSIIKSYSDLANTATGTVNEWGQGAGGGLSDIRNGNITHGLEKILSSVPQAGGNLIEGVSNVGANIGNNIGSAVGNVAKGVGGAVKSVGKKLKKRFSDENLKHNIKPADSKIYALLDKINAHEYDYNKEVHGKHGATPGKHISVMAQELESSELGKELIDNSNPEGKMVDYDKAEPIQLAAIASIHKRLKKLEEK